MNNKNNTKVTLIVVGCLLIIDVAYPLLKDITIRADRPIFGEVVINLMGLLTGILFNPIAIIGICLIIIANRKKQKECKSEEK